MKKTRIEVFRYMCDTHYGYEEKISAGSYDLLHFLKRSVKLGLHRDTEIILEVKK